MNQVLFTALEPRMLLSGNVVTVDPVALEAARVAALAAFASLQAHYTTNKAAVDAARQTLVEHRNGLAAQLKPLIAELRSDKAAYKVELKQNKADIKSIRDIWRPVIAADQLDVMTDTEGESAEERAADIEKLAADRSTYEDARAAAYAAMDDTRVRWEAEIESDYDAIDDARYASKQQLRTDERAVKTAQRTLKSVFNTDKLILADAIEDYRDAGGKKKDLNLPKLPCA